jgi:hypothetical protein
VWFNFNEWTSLLSNCRCTGTFPCSLHQLNLHNQWVGSTHCSDCVGCKRHR